jgi:hypothetical protein
MKSATRLLTLAALLAAGPALAADPKVCQDTTAIDWYFPGDFEAARTAAEKSNRILLIKGIAFGVDAAGAKCATKGCW